MAYSGDSIRALEEGEVVSRSLFCYYDTMPWPRQLTKETFYWGWHNSRGLSTVLTRQQVQRERWNGRVFRNLKASSTKATTLHPSHTVLLARGKVFKHMCLRGTFSLKPPQATALGLLWLRGGCYAGHNFAQLTLNTTQVQRRTGLMKL